MESLSGKTAGLGDVDLSKIIQSANSAKFNEIPPLKAYKKSRSKAGFLNL